VTSLTVARKSAHPSLSFGPFLLTRVGLIVDGEPTWEEWQKLYDSLQDVEDVSNWAIGDAEAHTRPQYGEAAEQLTANWPEHEYPRIRNARWVAEKVELATRVANLSWSHHRAVSKLPAEEQRLWLADAATNTWDVHELEQEIRRGKPPRELPEPPDGQYAVIAIDPPWPYGTEYSAEGRRAASPYREMDLEKIAAIALPAADDCVLWLWTTHAFMRPAFSLLDGWGFQEKAILTWVKDRMGLGAWLRSKSEFCIMAIKGKPQINLTNQTTVLEGRLREHSRKPDEFYAMVESLCLGTPRLDYFSRQRREGWDVYGDEPDKF
jgi:N6-adenosine-specific RNA methylase IME4